MGTPTPRARIIRQKPVEELVKASLAGAPTELAGFVVITIVIAVVVVNARCDEGGRARSASAPTELAGVGVVAGVVAVLCCVVGWGGNVIESCWSSWLS